MVGHWCLNFTKTRICILIELKGVIRTIRSKHPLQIIISGREEALKNCDRYKIDYSAVAVKSRCVPGSVNKAYIINKLLWSGRRDSNSRPSAPKADALPGCATPRRAASIVTRIGFLFDLWVGRRLKNEAASHTARARGMARIRTGPRPARAEIIGLASPSGTAGGGRLPGMARAGGADSMLQSRG